MYQVPFIKSCDVCFRPAFNRALDVNHTFASNRSIYRGLKLVTMRASHSWPSSRVRSEFVKYFEDRGHEFVDSSSVVPRGDPSLLFVNAGMNQFKPIFLGNVETGSHFNHLKRACNWQKCIRAGGKHNDLEDVGQDSYHHTFFEMLGNWSFGDYFKEDAARYAWELLTQVYKIPADRLYVTYFCGDANLGIGPDVEALQIWRKLGVQEDHILPGDAKDNFWEMGAQGPCGPCSEIHYDRIGGRNASGLVNKDDPDVLEIWNLVFMQYDRKIDGSLTKLPSQHIDTGMGFERLVSIMQNKKSNYDTDVFQTIFETIESICKIRPYSGKFGSDDIDGVDTAYRVLADHVRTLVFAISDGCLPNNEGKGYVLRRILRRGARFARKYMNYTEGDFFVNLAPAVIHQMKDVYPDLVKSQQMIQKVFQDEEESFARTLTKGEKLFEMYAATAIKSGSSTLDGLHVWRLYDTYGFPLDLTKLMAQEKKLEIDEEGFETARKESYEVSKKLVKKQENSLSLNVHNIADLNDNGVPKTDDIHKYTEKSMQATIKKFYDGKNLVNSISGTNKVCGIILDKTCCYSEQGGQIYDTGVISFKDKNIEFNVENVQSFNGYALHVGTLVQGSLNVNDEVTVVFDEERRHSVKNNHTGTHILNFALRKILGTEIEQKGSLVDPKKLRFDFSYNKPLTAQQICDIESVCNDQINQKFKVDYKVVPLNKAQSIKSIRTISGESYPDPVRIVTIGCSVDNILASSSNEKWWDYSMEYCGGTHVSNTSVISSLLILEETGIAKGIRRLVAVTGEEAVKSENLARKFEQELLELNKLSNNVEKTKNLKEFGYALNQAAISITKKNKLKQLFADIDKIHKDFVRDQSKQRCKLVTDKIKYYFQTKTNSDVFIDAIDSFADPKAVVDGTNYMRKSNKTKSLFLITSDPNSGNVAYGCYISDDATKSGIDGNKLITEVSQLLSGKGGGKGNVFQGVGINSKNIQQTIEYVNKLFKDSCT